ncbi:LysE family translocator [Cereibacter johrii]|uniref:LysE family translocator n=1 Tax=Cereibacter johrii TaxID=445629 RepID=UPI0002A26622|nr:LysE family transporter [Cereibacter johrii]EKX56966.1 L-lysine permease [Rhodobacter sp. AKP1]QCP85988.1 LysE family translocator [Cereibacter sphaeroides]RDS96239.1 LysE family translocator [Cereibacter sphaeroides f. sp. denitrificans]MEA5161572.1 LysE family transporter [Cereibacter johrii]RAZ87824.1 LysE family translocator [Cereibacter johrii]
MSLAAFAAAWLLHLMAAISPGPAVLMSARTGMSEGLRTGAILALGLAAGALVWASAALFGLALLFKVAPSLLWGMKIAGALYLLRMAYVMWREADRPFDTGQAGRPPRSAASAFRLGLFTQLSNPKPAVFFSAIFIGTVPQDAAPWAVGLLLLAVFLNEFLWNTFVARVFSFERARSGYISLKSVIDRSFGGLLALLGVKLAAF